MSLYIGTTARPIVGRSVRRRAFNMPDTYQPTVIVPVGRTGGRTPPGADSVSSRPVNTTSTSSTSASSSSSSSSGASSASSKSKASSSSSSSGASSASSKSKASSSSSSSYRSTSVVPAAARHQCTRQRTMMCSASSSASRRSAGRRCWRRRSSYACCAAYTAMRTSLTFLPPFPPTPSRAPSKQQPMTC